MVFGEKQYPVEPEDQGFFCKRNLPNNSNLKQV